MPVEPLENGHFVLFWSFLACFWQNKSFPKDSTDLNITQQKPPQGPNLIYSSHITFCLSL